ncbi:Chaperone protein DnaJ [uncultured archaeon]|nr:Chaperone protein DnaJ [uncultured archaeon]
MAKDYYSILGLSRNASDEDIKKAYRKIVLECHPDRNKSKEAHEKFKEATEDYSILSDSQKKQKYDSGGFDQNNDFNFSNGAGFNTTNFEDLGFNVQDLFRDFFGQNFEQTESQQKIYLIGITLEECFSGVTKNLEVNVINSCKHCHGKGFLKSKTCSKCHGSGRILIEKRVLGMHFQSVSTCNECNGVGEIGIEKCNVCRGAGKTSSNQTFEVKIPQGVEDGTTFILPSHDLVEVRLKKHDRFKVQGIDLVTFFTLNIPDWVLGGEFDLKHLNQETVYFKLDSQHDLDEPVKLEGMGLKRGRNKGDLLVYLKLKQKNLSSEESNLYKKLREMD